MRKQIFLGKGKWRVASKDILSQCLLCHFFIIIFFFLLLCAPSKAENIWMSSFFMFSADLYLQYFFITHKELTRVYWVVVVVVVVVHWHGFKCPSQMF